MADNTILNTGSGGDTVSTDELLVLNGGIATGGQKIQRVKPSFGPDGIANDAHEGNPLPVMDSERVVDLLAQIALVLNNTVLRTSTGLVPALRIANSTAGDLIASVTGNVSITGNAAVNVAQVASTTIYTVGSGFAPGQNGNAAPLVAQSTAYHLPVVPQHLYSQITG